jgi:hypothetical protein
MPFGLGFFATAGAGAGAAGSFDLLETTIVGAGGAASVTFSSLGTYASTYQHLQIRMTARANRPSSTTDPLIITLNGTGQTNAHVLYGNGSTVGAGAIGTSYSLLDAITGPNASTSAFGACVIDILDPFETTKNKTMRALTVANTVGALGSVLFGTTASTTSITITPFSATNYLQGSRFSLYGLKAA